MSATMLQMVQQVTAELNLPVPTYVAGNPTPMSNKFWH